MYGSPLSDIKFNCHIQIQSICQCKCLMVKMSTPACWVCAISWCFCLPLQSLCLFSFLRDFSFNHVSYAVDRVPLPSLLSPLALSGHPYPPLCVYFYHSFPLLCLHMGIEAIYVNGTTLFFCNFLG